MATNQVFKGDLAEVSMAKETGLFGQGNGTAGGATATSGWNSIAGATPNTSKITIGEAMYWVDTDGKMKVPKNMLIGATLRFHSSTGNFSADDHSTTKKSFFVTANDSTTITIQPKLTTGIATAAAADTFIIDNIRIPTFDSACASGSSESVRADQFLGLLNNFSLPEPELDVRKQHIVGMGRDVNILTTGKETLSGGAYDVNAHSMRFLKYALGGHTALGWGEFAHATGAGTIEAGATVIPLNLKPTGTSQTLFAQQVGDFSRVEDVTQILANGTATGITGGGGTDIESNVDCLIGGKTASGSGTSAGGNGVINIATTNFNVIFENIGTSGVFKVLEQLDAGGVQYGYYGAGAAASLQLSAAVDITPGAVATAIVAARSVYVLASLDAAVLAGDLRIDVGVTNAAKFAAGDYIQIVDSETVQVPGADTTAPTLHKHEIRRVLAVGTANGGDAKYVYVEEPFLFGHSAGKCGIERMKYTYDSASKRDWERGSPALQSTGELKYGITHRLFGYSYLPTFGIEQSFRTTDVTPGANQLLRVFSGCKMNACTVKADSEGELKISGDYEAGRMFTDTTGKFLIPHRMFENTAETHINRRVSGIAVNGEKPYLFQHIQLSAFGAPLLRAISAEIGISNSNTARWYVRGTEGTYADADQVQESATQYAAEITEAAREYTFKFSALVEDDRWFDQLRTRKHHINTNDITMILSKPGSHASRQNAKITVEDYTITKATHPMPDDKGPVTAEVECAVRHLKVEETSPYFIL
tara:strand:- start:41410 stop:43695 length:2286 start_codon:yes stop_codon:yes gene_type:complete